MKVEGLTGHIEFKEGSRANFSVDVMETVVGGGVKKIGSWSDVYGFVSGSAPKRKKAREGPDPNKVYIVTSILVSGHWSSGHDPCVNFYNRRRSRIYP